LCPVFKTNGSISVDDVSPVDYELDVSDSDPDDSDDRTTGLLNAKQIGSLRKDFTVTQASESGAPFDVGTLELNPQPSVIALPVGRLGEATPPVCAAVLGVSRLPLS
jgi:hypothetical protein